MGNGLSSLVNGPFVHIDPAYLFWIFYIVCWVFLDVNYLDCLTSYQSAVISLGDCWGRSNGPSSLVNGPFVYIDPSYFLHT